MQQASNQTLAGALSDSIQNIQGLLPASKGELMSEVGVLAARDTALEKTVNLLVSEFNSLTPVRPKCRVLQLSCLIPPSISMLFPLTVVVHA